MADSSLISHSAPPPPSGKEKMASADASKLEHLGIKQELRREWGVLQNFGSSFSIISIPTGVTTLFLTGLLNGGPGVMVTGWIVVSVMTTFVAMGMAEITSSIPTAGGPFYWAAVLAPPKQMPFWAWITGWSNFVGQFAVTTGITFGCAGLISTLATVRGYEATAPRTIGIYAALLISHGLVNSFGVKTLKYLNNQSIVLHSVGVGALAIAVVAKAPTHQPASFVFSTFYDGTGGWSERASPAYVAIVGILLAQYTITGFDASAHMSEETANAERNAPIGVMMSVVCSAIWGFFYLLALLFSIQDYEAVLDSPSGQPVLEILLQIFGETGATVLFVLIIVCVWHCGLFSLTSNSRMMFAFARDGGALPKIFARVDRRFKSPINTVWLAATLAFILALPSLGSAVAFSAATSIATIGLYVSYAIPIGLAAARQGQWEKGPFNLKGASRAIGVIACAWVGFISIVFCLPAVNPVTSQTLNYTPVAVGIVIIATLVSWFLWARKWYKGPNLNALGDTFTAALEETTGKTSDDKLPAVEKVVTGA